MEEMQRDLPEKRYERNMSHNYLVLSSYDFFGQKEEDSYTARMILGNKIPGLLPVVCRRSTGEKQYCYEINSLQPLDRLYEKTEIGYEALHALLAGCIRTLECLEEYLLDGTQIILSPDYIYLQMDTNEPFLVCYPEYYGDIRRSFAELADYLLTKINHTQEQAVWLAYQVYRYTRNPNYVLGEIKDLLYEAEEMRRVPKTEPEYGYIRPSADQADSILAQERNRRSEDIDEKNDDDYDSPSIQSKEKWKNIAGVIICVIVALGALGIILGSKIFPFLSLSHKQETGLYGAMGMAVVAAGIFFAGQVKLRKQEKQRKELQTEPEEEVDYWNVATQQEKQPWAVKQMTFEPTGETVCLSGEYVRERCLQGNVNGESVKIPLNHFPIILGKLAGLSDYVISDDTVSRMHARLEQRNGQIFISDLNSTNGTIKNGNMLSMNEAVALEPGDQITLGRVSFTYC